MSDAQKEKVRQKHLSKREWWVSAIQTKLLSIIGDRGPAGQVVRSLLPWSSGFVLLMAGLHLMAERQDFYRADIATWLFAAVNIAVIAGLIWRTADGLQGSDLARRNSERDLQHRATHDRLTGLTNRGLFIDCLENRIKKAIPGDTPGFAVLYLDVDEFKTINDRLGHQAGDRLLTVVAERISKSVRESDLVSRMGGDEFTVLLEEITAPNDVERIAQRIVDAFSRNICIRDRNIQVGISIGAAIYSDHHETAELILEDADAALYQAKFLGKGRYAIAHSTTDTIWLEC